MQIIASDVQYTLNFKIGRTNLQKCCVYNDDFTIVTATENMDTIELGYEIYIYNTTR